MLYDGLVTIVVPVYNIESQILKQCIESVICQTYKNIEVLIIDDGSKAECAIECDKYIDNSLISVFHKENGGVSTARNYGIEKAKGDFITFIDSDDWIEPNYISRMLEFFDFKTDIVICDRIMEYPNQSEVSYFFNEQKTFSYEEQKKSLVMTTINIPVGGTWCKMYRKSFIDNKRLCYDVELRRTQDVLFNLYAFNYANKIIYIREPLYHYRMDNQSITKKYSDNADVVLTKTANAFEKYREYFFPNDEEVKQLVYYRNVNILSEIMKLKYFNPNNNNPYVAYKDELKKIISLDVYQRAINGVSLSKIPNEYVRNSKMNIIFTCAKIWLLKRPHLKLLKGLMGLHKRLQNARNYHSQT